MTKIDLTVYPEKLEHAINRARERNIIIPTIAQMKNPELVPDKINTSRMPLPPPPADGFTNNG